jgi:hypothetical protein
VFRIKFEFVSSIAKLPIGIRPISKQTWTRPSWLSETFLMTLFRLSSAIIRTSASWSSHNVKNMSIAVLKYFVDSGVVRLNKNFIVDQNYYQKLLTPRKFSYRTLEQFEHKKMKKLIKCVKNNIVDTKLVYVSKSIMQSEKCIQVDFSPWRRLLLVAKIFCDGHTVA